MQTYSITLTADDINVIAAALAEQPFKVVVGVIAKLQAQVNQPSPETAPAENDS